MFGESGEIAHLRRLTGGANMESWAFDYGDRRLVLRRTPGNGERNEDLSRITMESEARLIALACEQGVSAPPVMGILKPEDDLGQGYVMERIAGETLPHKILDNPDFAKAEQQLAGQCAGELAKIHAIPLDRLPADMPRDEAKTLLAGLAERYREYGAHVPVFDYALRWLEDHLPEPAQPCLLHGDFRMGNLMIDGDGIAAILDWELAHIGDPAQDLAYLCTPSWRFTRHDKPVGGFAGIDEFLNAYEAASGAAVERTRFDFWLVYSTLWWGVCCLGMTSIWRTGQDRTLERAVIGRRVSEVEVDLLLLFDPMLDESADRKIDWALPAAPSHKGQTHSAELLEALIGWDSDDVIPHARSRDLFQARVAKNAMGMLQREAVLGPVFDSRQRERLKALGLTADELRMRLAEGTLSPADPALLAHLRLTALERLSVDQPRYPGLAAALKQWTMS
ncbi:phosphotransferase family protein [Parasphingopyxis lamellibrachiae]|uniref:Aminoglycoside phosphotransferase (APT) family kinase protein n=1 Tax=Parasphingopyxis lamellibrachiae TaxID=680125 RepID=A0A3D9FDZ4_9SPHN|nr:phosphotransferase family protein [Parasphingopyxis lamellibrachiae]RED15888.1 aminoglycoside phosphotransferase (APT) family kinase protein [Parasphingopyxis lamellibrachiae]